MQVVEKVIDREEHLEVSLQLKDLPTSRPSAHADQPQCKNSQDIVRRICGQTGHYARGCAIKQIPTEIAKQDLKSDDNASHKHNLQTIAINNVSSYTLSCTVNNHPVSFLVDTDAGVCLLIRVRLGNG